MANVLEEIGQGFASEAVQRAEQAGAKASAEVLGSVPHKPVRLSEQPVLVVRS